MGSIKTVANLSLLVVSLAQAFQALGTNGASRSGSEITINVDAGSEFTYDEAIGTDVSRVIKTGSGTLVVNRDNSSFTGAVDIDAGIVHITHCGALGRSTAQTRMADGAITVAAKAQLYAHLVRQGQAFEQISKRLVLSGSGPDGVADKWKGALLARPNGTAAGGSYTQDGWIAHLELSDDATVNIADSRIGVKTTDLREHTLTVGNYYDNGYVDFSMFDCTHLSSGTIVTWGTGADYQGGYGLLFCGDATFPDSAVNLVLDASMLKLVDFDASDGLMANVRMCNTYNGKKVRIYASAIASAEYRLRGGLQIDSPTIVSASSASSPLMTIRQEGDVSGAGNLEVSGSNMIFIASGRWNGYSGNFIAVTNGGTAVFQDVGTISIGDNPGQVATWRVGGGASDGGASSCMTIGGSSALVAAVPDWGVRQRGGLWVEEPSGPGAVLEVRPGAGITNTIHVGENANMRGAVHQYGGSVYNNAVSGNDAYCGCEHGSYGYYGLYGGAFEYRALFACGYYSDSTGIFEQRGGVMATESQAYVGRHGGWAEYHMTGGELAMPNGVIVGRGSDATAQQAVMTLCGDGCPTAKVEYAAVCLSGGAGAFTSVLNLNAGVLKTRKIERYAAQVSADNHAFVNFGGSTVALNSYDNVSFFGSGSTAIDRITVFPGGMVFDTNGNSCPQDANTPFLRPSGRGVASIALPSGMANGRYIGAPEVRISGGGGMGATAHAVYDPQTRSVTGIEVTCPGWDYVAPPTVTIATADRSGTVSCTASLTEGESQPGGGLTKAGRGTLTLMAQNTYVGSTVLRAGVLKCGANGVIPLDSMVVFEGGEFDMNGKTMSDGSSAPRRYGVDCAAVLAKGSPIEYPYSLNFPENSTLALLNPDVLDPLPEEYQRITLLTIVGGFSGSPTLTGLESDKWLLCWVGNTLKAVRKRGFVLMFK